MRFLAAVVGPLACWSPLFLYYFLPDIFLGKPIDQPSQAPDSSSIYLASIIYFPLSSAICGFSASYFLREEYAKLPEGTKITTGFWTQFLFVLPLLFNPTTLCCLFGIVIPIHIGVFNQVFLHGVKFWQDERSKQLIGEYEKPTEEA